MIRRCWATMYTTHLEDARHPVVPGRGLVPGQYTNPNLGDERANTKWNQNYSPKFVELAHGRHDLQRGSATPMHQRKKVTRQSYHGSPWQKIVTASSPLIAGQTLILDACSPQSGTMHGSLFSLFRAQGIHDHATSFSTSGAQLKSWTFILTS